MKRVFIVAGDPSGDLIAAQLVESLKKLNPGLQVCGVGGRHLKQVSDRFLENIVGQHALGFAIGWKQISYFRGILNNVIIPELKANPPDAVIPVDFYGFNSVVAASAKSLGCRVFYYASPQFWASRPWRADRLRKIVDLFLCLFPFEIEFYRKRNLPAQFVGHPILDVLPEMPENVPPKVEPRIGLLPGSRPAEIRRHLPVMVEACGIIRKEIKGARFFLFTVPHVPRDLYNELIKDSIGKTECLIELVQEEDFAWRSQLDAAMTASGMETFENAILGIPMVIIYKTNLITYAVARMLIRVPYLGMPNLLAGKGLIPEFIQWNVNAKKIAAPITRWLKNPLERLQLRKDLLSLRKKFGGNGASERAARAIMEKVA
jgi:lipid-A-disaccharide synthase